MTSSSGYVFARPGQAERVVRSGLDALILVVDGITQETYARYREGGRLETALEDVRAVVAAKRALGSPTPLVKLRFIVMRHNEHEIPALRRLARSLGVDALTLKTLNPDQDRETDRYAGEFLPTRREFRSDYRRIDLCRNCSDAYVGGSRISETIAEALFFEPA